MKKIYLLTAFALSTVLYNAQVIESDNYDSYTLGDVGTNFALGTPAGQGGMYLGGGSAPDYQIVNIDATHDKSLMMTSGATAVAASNRQVVKGGFGPAWLGRTSGNDILKATFEIYTGSSTGNVGNGFNVTNSAGGIVGIRYNTADKVFTGQANLTNISSGAKGFYNITGISTVTYPANTWVKVGFTYDKVNGVITFTIDGVTVSLAIAGYTITKNLDGTQFNGIQAVVAGNSATNTVAFDNYVVEAVNSASMGVTTVGQIEGKEAIIDIYPNPTSDYISIKSDSKIKSVNIIDMSGRSTASRKLNSNNQIDVRNLPKGSYIINIETEEGIQSKKFIKK